MGNCNSHHEAKGGMCKITLRIEDLNGDTKNIEIDVPTYIRNDHLDSLAKCFEEYIETHTLCDIKGIPITLDKLCLSGAGILIPNDRIQTVYIKLHGYDPFKLTAKTFITPEELTEQVYQACGIRAKVFTSGLSHKVPVKDGDVPCDCNTITLYQECDRTIYFELNLHREPIHLVKNETVKSFIVKIHDKLGINIDDYYIKRDELFWSPLSVLHYSLKAQGCSGGCYCNTWTLLSRRAVPHNARRASHE